MVNPYTGQVVLLDDGMESLDVGGDISKVHADAVIFLSPSRRA